MWQQPKDAKNFENDVNSCIAKGMYVVVILVKRKYPDREVHQHGVSFEASNISIFRDGSAQ